MVNTIEKCFAFRIPPQSSATGHRAEDWPRDPAWSGKMVISSKGDILYIKLLEIPSNKVFAVCPIERNGTQAVQKVTDSSRYFVLRIVDGTRHAFIGIAFDSRSDAFDFNVAIDDHTKQVQREQVVPVPTMDYSLKEGQTMHIQLNSKQQRQQPQPHQTTTKPVKHSFDEWETF